MYCLDERFWLAASFLLFLYCAYRPVKKAILASLDDKIAAVKEQVLMAVKLNEDANILFERTATQLAQIGNLRIKILQDAQVDVNKLIEARHKEIELFLERRKSETISAIHNQKLQACQMMQYELGSKIIELVTVYFQSVPNDSLLDNRIAQKLIENHAKGFTK